MTQNPRLGLRTRCHSRKNSEISLFQSLYCVYYVVFNIQYGWVVNVVVNGGTWMQDDNDKPRNESTRKH